MPSSPSAKTPLSLSAALIAAGLLVGLVGGLGTGSLIGGVIALFGIIPACYATWVGMQKETQASLGMGLLLIFASLGVGALLLILWLVDLLS